MNYYEIADYNPISENFIIPRDFLPIRRYDPAEVLSPDAMSKFNFLGFNLREVQLFTTPPYTTTGIHIDGHDINKSKSAINFVVNGPGFMKWYRLKNTTPSSSMTTTAGTGYMSYEFSECELTDSLAITKLTLVEVCQPHNIFNNTNSFRYCFSIRHNDASDFNLIKEKVSQWNNLFN
jgi:hypothetical protein